LKKIAIPTPETEHNKYERSGQSNPGTAIGKQRTSAQALGAGVPSKLRILMVAPQPFFRPRGTPFSVLHRIRALCEQGHSVDLITYPFGEDVEIAGLTIIRCARPPLIRDVKIGPSLTKLLLDVPLYLESRRALKRQRYDVLHSHEEAAFFCVSLAKKHGMLHIYDMHSSLPQQLQNFSAFNIAPIRSLFERLEHYVLESCDGVTTICQELAETAVPLCGDTPHAMIENTADDQRVFKGNNRDVVEELELDGKHIILYTGTFETYQGLDLLLAAFSRTYAAHPTAHLLMVGGQPEQVKEYRERSRELGLEGAVTFVGSVHPSEIPSYLDAAEIIASPRSRGTNTPLKIYGYMRSGKPIVATNMLTHTQTLKPSFAYLVEPTVEGLANGLIRLIENPKLGRSLADAALRIGERDYSDAGYVAKVDDLYSRVLENSRSSRWCAANESPGVPV
jgi:glycosyltransferase involved in cell wall biosynthesis